MDVMPGDTGVTWALAADGGVCRVVMELFEGRSSGDANDSDDATLFDRGGEVIVGGVVVVALVFDADGGDAMDGDAVDGDAIGDGRPSPCPSPCPWYPSPCPW